jgi:signal transduction histidine kinase
MLVVIKNRALLGLDAGGDPGLVTHLTEISTAAGGAIDEVRKVAYGLRPYQLDRLGVTRALQSLVEQTAAASGLALTADIDELEGMLTKNDEVNVYRIVQEAVNNTVRHARAKSGRVAVGASQHEIDIRIEDDGVGFDPAGQDGGLGLAGIAERARILGGRMTVRSSSGQGTTVSVSIPSRGRDKRQPNCRRAYPHGPVRFPRTCRAFAGRCGRPRPPHTGPMKILGGRPFGATTDPGDRPCVRRRT